MRYSIRLAALLRCGESLERAARAERREIEELLSVIRQLNGLWGMSGIISGLRREVQDMEEQVQITLTMAQAARRIHQIYMDMERSITDAADCPFRLEPGHSGCTAPVFPSGAGSSPVPPGTGTAGTGDCIPPPTVDTPEAEMWALKSLLRTYLTPVYGQGITASVLQKL